MAKREHIIVRRDIDGASVLVLGRRREVYSFDYENDKAIGMGPGQHSAEFHHYHRGTPLDFHTATRIARRLRREHSKRKFDLGIDGEASFHLVRVRPQRPPPARTSF